MANKVKNGKKRIRNMVRGIHKCHGHVCSFIFHCFNIRSFPVLLLILFNTLRITAQNATFDQYIKRYSDLAIQEAKKHQIPASITLAQALLESGAGQSTLAKQANNHFGIKCHSDWKGGRTYKNAEKPNECFRKYKSVEDSYADHSRFLTERSRYAPLFKINKTDYSKWAKGLQDCGYATDKKYANKLISLIETYQLHRYDTMDGKSASPDPKTSSNEPPSRAVSKIYGLKYITAGDEDSFGSIAGDLGIKAKNLAKYNEAPIDFPLRQGDIIYLEKKKKKADKPNLNHRVQVGESMHSISQRYGLRLKYLYKMNHKDADYVPEVGDILKLR